VATTAHKRLLFFTNAGRVFMVPAYEIPATSRTAKGNALQNFIEISAQERVTAIYALPDEKTTGEYLTMATTNGLIKKTPLEDFANIRRSGLKAINLKGSDTLEWVEPSSKNDQVFLVTRSGQSIRFKATDIRAMGRTAAGVRGIKLAKNDEVVAMHIIPKDKVSSGQVLVITKNGYGKRTNLNQYRIQGRGGTGIKTAKITTKTGQIVNGSIINKPDVKNTDVLIISEKGQVIRISAHQISELGRSTQGVKVMNPTDMSGQVATFTTWLED
jgi:DNA gyrase subunit A